MSMVEKGTIIDFGGDADDYGDKMQARIQPLDKPENETYLLTIPWYYRGETGKLEPGDEVAYVVFDDNTGIILSRMDGNWTGFIKGKSIELIKENNHKGNIICKGDFVCEGDAQYEKNIECKGDMACKDVTVKLLGHTISLNSHKHIAPNGNTSTPIDGSII